VTAGFNELVMGQSRKSFAMIVKRGPRQPNVEGPRVSAQAFIHLMPAKGPQGFSRVKVAFGAATRACTLTRQNP